MTRHVLLLTLSVFLTSCASLQDLLPVNTENYREITSVNTIMEAQRVLRSQGFYRSSIDGVVGDGTRAALRSYQQANGLSINFTHLPVYKSIGLNHLLTALFSSTIAVLEYKS